MNLPRITSAMLLVTHSCNLACKYCFVHQEPSFMTYETAKDAADFLISNCQNEKEVPEINFFGGEPLLMWDKIIKPLTLYIREELKTPFSLGMTSNCILMNEEKLEFMKKYGITLLFSIDGDKATQDCNRPFHNGDSSFNVLKPIIPKIVEYYPDMTFRMTTTPDTCQHIFDNITFAKSHGYKNFFVVPNVFEEWSKDRREVAEKEMLKYSDHYIDSYRNGSQPMNFSTFNEALSDIKRINEASRTSGWRVTPKCQSCGKCGLGANKFASIHPNGNVYGCQEMTSNEGEEGIFYIGNIYTGIKDELRAALMSKFDGRMVVGDDCPSCIYNNVCDGGCVANNYLNTGDLNHMPEVFCWWKRTVLNAAIYAMQTLGAEENEAFRQKWRG